jgi:hypothetical protein
MTHGMIMLCYEINRNLAHSTSAQSNKTQNAMLDIWHLNSLTRVLAVYTGAIKQFSDKSGNKMTFLIYYIYFNTFYQGADKFLARPGRQQARKHVRDVRGFNNIETRAVIKFFFFFPARQVVEGNLRHSDRNISLFPSWLG